MSRQGRSVKTWPKVMVNYEFQRDAIALWIWMSDRHLWRLNENGSWQTAEVDPDAYEEPSVWLPSGSAENVVAAIVDYAQSADGYVPTEARNDYLDERKRVDKLTDAVIDLAKRGSS